MASTRTGDQWADPALNEAPGEAAPKGGEPATSLRLTKTVVDRAAPPSQGQRFLRDRELSGFALRVSAGGVKAFVVEKRVGGRVRRQTLGRYPALTVEQARREAQKELGKIAMGIDTIAERERERMRAITVAAAWHDFKRDRTHLKPKTLYDYGRVMEVAFADWQRKPLGSISRDMVSERHRDLAKERGGAYANLAMRFLRSLFNWAIDHYEDGFGRAVLDSNPVVRLTKSRAWAPERRRRTIIKEHQLAAWFAAVMRMRGADDDFARTVADYLLLVVLTGLRRQEAAQLTWDCIDLRARTLFVPATKNGLPHLLPLSTLLHDLLERRQRIARSAYVFAGAGRAGYLVEPRNGIARVAEESGVKFSIHDLRRTFLTAADALDVSAFTIKRLANHSTKADVTSGYIVTDVERLREPMQKICDYFVKEGGVHLGEPIGEASADTAARLAAEVAA